ncbi:MAG TPA: 50S ribosomal protein L17 [Candidatus Paceibacterota bacterium]
MRHHNNNRKLGRERNQRKALLRALAVALVKREKIETTEAKAKELRPLAERLITYSKKESLSGQRAIKSVIGEKMASKVIETIGPRYKDRSGGYTRITKLGRRLSDGSPRAIIEWV